MSLYNMMNGVNQATFWILPMLGEKHPDSYPRFRDCFVGALQNSDEKNEYGLPIKYCTAEEVISVYTRVGGINREEYKEEIKELRKHPNYLRDYDDSFDSTFATFIFSVPEEFKSDFDIIMTGELKNTSQAYKDRLYLVFPKLKETFDKLFINP